MGGGEFIDAPDQPARGKDAADCQVEHAFVAAFKAGQPILQRSKPGSQLRQRLHEGGQGAQALRGALEQFKPQSFFGTAQMLADGANGDAQFLGSRGQGAAARHDFDGAQGVQWNGKACAHIDFL